MINIKYFHKDDYIIDIIIISGPKHARHIHQNFADILSLSWSTYKKYDLIEIEGLKLIRREFTDGFTTNHNITEHTHDDGSPGL